MHIYDKFVALCSAKGVDEVTAYQEIPINKGTISLWRTAKKNGDEKIPSPKMAMKMSNYFGVPMSYILGETDDPSDRSKTHWMEFLPDKKEKSPTLEGVELDLDRIKVMLGEMTAEDLSALISDAAAELAKRKTV